MNRLILASCLTAALTTPGLAAAQAGYTCGPARVHDVRIVTEIVTRQTATTRRTAHGAAEARVERVAHEENTIYVVTAQLNNVLYTSRSTGDPYGTLDPRHLVAGDAVGLCADGIQMILERPDGKDYRAKIVRTEPAPSRPRGTP